MRSLHRNPVSGWIALTALSLLLFALVNACVAAQAAHGGCLIA